MQKSELGGREIRPEPLKRTKPSLLKGVVLNGPAGSGSSQRSGRTGVKPPSRKISAKTGILAICLDPPPPRGLTCPTNNRTSQTSEGGRQATKEKNFG